MDILHKKFLRIIGLLELLLRSRSELTFSVKCFSGFDSVCCELLVIH